jgi:uncharacterized protein (DUF1330 family)
VLELTPTHTSKESPVNSTAKLAIATVAGVVIGALGVEATRAQPKPPGFLVVEYEVTDPVGWKTYVDGARAAPSGGTFLVRAAKGTSLAGEPPKTITIVQFATVEDAVAFDSSPQYAALKPIRDKSSKWRSYVVEGVQK